MKAWVFLPGLFLTALMPVLGVAQIPPTNPFNAVKILPGNLFGTQGAAGSGTGEEIRVMGHRRTLPVFFDSPIVTRYFEDGHTESRVTLWKGMTAHLKFGRDLDHDPVTGTNTSRFGEAYATSSPLLPR
ncbi:hypothetical protein HK22_02340 [Gluconobacter sp. DsW_056]|uniref:hypothetical protein n=1 Tax=Gluconobacter sp. DsW_056 TaxID=1511209 RepID=UPI000A3CE4CF|nr:hypothetical protein [Gluconobacter sp. DsW_056]OUI81713.1 hypothetical protein HK22_02340 [Gluconobacter sp. DsW_056]